MVRVGVRIISWYIWCNFEVCKRDGLETADRLFVGGNTTFKYSTTGQVAVSEQFLVDPSYKNYDTL